MLKAIVRTVRRRLLKKRVQRLYRRVEKLEVKIEYLLNLRESL